ncbi:helix-turn-helix domain-containing protein [Clostridium sp.]|uniref:helix-turn-helix domain-containing protein n=1 Tax=Clostridium sp. TaxID=1506 RepID=UPI0035A11F51
MLFGDKLRYLREEKGVTQKQLGEFIHVSDRVVGYYESNNRFPKNEETLKRIAQYFNVSIDYLLGNSNNKNIDEPKIPETDKKLIDDITSLDDDLKKEAKKYIELLKLKQNIDASKDENSATLDQDIC